MTLPDSLTEDPDGEIHMKGHRIGLYTVVRCEVPPPGSTWSKSSFRP